MITKTYLSKMNSIIKGSDINTGINPVSELVFGKNTSRVLCYFDHSKIKEMMEDGTMPDIDKIYHRAQVALFRGYEGRTYFLNLQLTLVPFASIARAM